MLSTFDFEKKQIVFVFFSDGEKMSFSNDNLVVKKRDGKIKLQCTCYRLFLVVAIGHANITSALIQKAQKFGFCIALMTVNFKLYSVIGACKDGNTLLRQKQYKYNGIEIAKIITKNKMQNQLYILKNVREKSDSVKESISQINKYIKKIPNTNSLNEIMAYEGLTSKTYFRNHFNNVLWQGRQPRIKRDYINSALDIGYTLLFAFVDALLATYGFDTYCGVMHKQFYMRKSLVCDIVEPFRAIIDYELKKAINLKQIKKEDFLFINYQFRLKWENSAKYVKIFMTPIIENKQNIFVYIKNFYRAFMKESSPEEYPVFNMGDKV